MPQFILLVVLGINLSWAWSPTGTYAPGKVDCPVGPLVQPAYTLCSEEKDWLEGRRLVVRPYLLEFLQRTHLDFDPTPLVMGSDVTIACAFSGGGYRAMLLGAGELAALDRRSPGSMGLNQLGGLLQASTYMAGLSGGAWLVTSVYFNNFSSIGELVGSRKVWNLQENLVWPNDPIQYWLGPIGDSLDKAQAGFPLSITDLWGRVLSKVLINQKGGGAALSWSDIQSFDYYNLYQAPLPIVTMNERPPGTVIMPTNATIFEVTPHYLGSFDPTVAAFARLKYLGSHLENGMPVEDRCINGFDNAGFICATSSSLFNDVLVKLVNRSRNIGKVIFSLIFAVADMTNLDIANFTPNPFYKFDNPLVPKERNKLASQHTLALVDEGETINMPFQPLLNPEREVDVIFAFDNSADTPDNWPNGIVLDSTFRRQFAIQSPLMGQRTRFPYVPPPTEFVEQELNKRPVFFGCDPSAVPQLPDSEAPLPPVIVYIPNSDISYASNFSTFQLRYPKTQLNGLINNGYNLATRANGTQDIHWQTCVACAILKRGMDRTGMQSDYCDWCFQEYCWAPSTPEYEEREEEQDLTDEIEDDEESDEFDEAWDNYDHYYYEYENSMDDDECDDTEQALG